MEGTGELMEVLAKMVDQQMEALVETMVRAEIPEQQTGLQVTKAEMLVVL